MSFGGFGWYVAFSLYAYVCLHYILYVQAHICTHCNDGCIVSLNDAYNAAEMCMCKGCYGCVCVVQKYQLFF